MSVSLERLRLLRAQAGEARPRASTATPPAAGAAQHARQPLPARPEPACVAQETRHARPAPAAPRAVADAAGLRRLLGVRERRSDSPAPRAGPRDRALPGTEVAPGLYLIEAFLPQDIPGQPLSLAFARREREQVLPQDLLFFDTETTGLAGGTGTRAFMIGAADWTTDDTRGPGLRVRQLLMATMAAETAMLRTFAGWLRPGTVLCSYNGRCYDAPLLKTRYRLARAGDPLAALDHVDLLFPTRRRYRGRWENCRLATIERQLLQVVRQDDLPGAEAPAAWLRYLRGGDALDLRRVGEHNHQDVVTLSLLVQRLVSEEQHERDTLQLRGQD